MRNNIPIIFKLIFISISAFLFIYILNIFTNGKIFGITNCDNIDAEFLTSCGTEIPIGQSRTCIFFICKLSQTQKYNPEYSKQPDQISISNTNPTVTSIPNTYSDYSKLFTIKPDFKIDTVVLTTSYVIDQNTTLSDWINNNNKDKSYDPLCPNCFKLISESEFSTTSGSKSIIQETQSHPIGLALNGYQLFKTDKNIFIASITWMCKTDTCTTQDKSSIKKLINNISVNN